MNRSEVDHSSRRWHWPSWLPLVVRELRHGSRRILRHRAFSVPAIGTLALGIGATVAAFAVLESVVLSPLPYENAERLVRIETRVPGIDPEARWGLAKGEFLYLRQEATSLESMGLYQFSRVTLSPEADAPARSVDVAEVSSGVFTTLGIRPSLGRLPVPEDHLEELSSVVWLGHELWLERFGGDPAIVGTTIPVDGRSVEVVGVLGPNARLPEEAMTSEVETGLWMPLWLDPAQPPVPRHVYRTLARRTGDSSLESASAELQRLTMNLPAALPQAYSDAYMEETGMVTELIPLHEHVVGPQVARALWILLGSVLLVFLVAYANVANLFLARLEATRNETAMRAALGASRGRLAAGYLAESLVLAAIAGVIGFLLAVGALRILHLRAPADLPRVDAIGVGGPAVAVTVGLVLATAILFGLLPALRQRGAREVGAAGSLQPVSRRARIARHVLVVAQVALSLLLLTAGALLFRSLRALTDVEPGFEPDGVLTFSVVLPEGRYDSYERVGTAYRSLATGLEEVAGIDEAAVAMILPLSGFDGCSSVFVDGRQPPPGEQPPCVPLFFVSPGYFDAMAIDVTGRSPDWADAQRRLPLAVVSLSLAERLWPAGDPIDREVSLSPKLDPFRVVAVAEDVRADGLDQPVTEAVYLPMTPPPGPQLWPPLQIVTVIARTGSGEPTALVPAVRRAIAEVDPQIALREIRPLSDIVARSMSRLSFFTLLLTAASTIAFVLSTIGMYGVVSYLVERRRTELGVRMALGARRRQVRRMVVRESVLLATAGVALGIVGALASTEVLESLLYDVSARDPWTLALVSLFLVLLAMAASWVPALRASRLPPADILRRE